MKSVADMTAGLAFAMIRPGRMSDGRVAHHSSTHTNCMERPCRESENCITTLGQGLIQAINVSLQFDLPQLSRSLRFYAGCSMQACKLKEDLQISSSQSQSLKHDKTSAAAIGFPRRGTCKLTSRNQKWWTMNHTAVVAPPTTNKA